MYIFLLGLGLRFLRMAERWMCVEIHNVHITALSSSYYYALYIQGARNI